MCCYSQRKLIGGFGNINETKEVLKRLKVKHATVFNFSKDVKSEGEWLGRSLLQWNALKVGL